MTFGCGANKQLGVLIHALLITSGHRQEACMAKSYAPPRQGLRMPPQYPSWTVL